MNRLVFITLATAAGACVAAYGLARVVLRPIDLNWPAPGQEPPALYQMSDFRRKVLDGSAS